VGAEALPYASLAATLTNVHLALATGNYVNSALIEFTAIKVCSAKFHLDSYVLN
jgi:hypothetical protein